MKGIESAWQLGCKAALGIRRASPSHEIALLAMVAVFAVAGRAVATPIAVGETGDSRSSATNVDASFSLPPPADVFTDLGSFPTATITSAIGTSTDVDWYSFTGKTGATLYLDIDDDPLTVDAILALFDGNGTLIAISDDSDPADPGTADTRDPFLGVFTIPADSLYYVAVSSFDNFPDACGTAVPCTQSGLTATQLTRPDGVPGGDYFNPVNQDGSVALSGATVGLDTYSGTGQTGGTYTLHITNSAAVPEPSTTLLLGGALLALGAARRVRQAGRRIALPGPCADLAASRSGGASPSVC